MKIFRTLITVVLMATLLLPNFAYAKDTKKIGKLTSITGTVQMQKSGGEKLFKAFKNMAITQGDTVITGSDGKATMDLDADKEVIIGPSTKLVISELVDSVKAKSGKTSISLQGGDVMVHVKKKLDGDSRFEVKTPTAIMGVMGTQFIVSYDNNGMSLVTVFEGTVAAKPPTESQGFPQPVLVNPSQQLEIDGGSNPVWMQPAVLNPAKLPLFVLEELALNPIPGLNEELLKKIQDELKKKQQEEANKPKPPVQKPTDKIIYEGIVESPPPSGGSSGNSGGGSGDGGSTDPIATTISLIENVNMLEGDSMNREFTVTPADAVVNVSYSVGGFENTLQNLGNGRYRWGISFAREQNLVATVTATKNGYVSAMSSFNVIVLPNPNPFVISQGIIDLSSDEDFRVKLGVKGNVDVDEVYLVRLGKDPLPLEISPQGGDGGGYGGDYYLANIDSNSRELVLTRQFIENLREHIDSSYTAKLSLSFSRDGFPIEPPLLITLDVNPIPIVAEQSVEVNGKTIRIPFLRGIALNSDGGIQALKQNIIFMVEGSSNQYDWTDEDIIEINGNELKITFAVNLTAFNFAYIIIMEGTLKDSISQGVQSIEIRVGVNP